MILEKTTRNENDVGDDDAMVAVAILMMMTTAMVAATMMVMRTKLVFSSNLAAVHAGGFATGIYQTNRWKNSKYDPKTSIACSASACQYIAEDSRANILVVGDLEQLAKVSREQRASGLFFKKKSVFRF